MNKPACTRYAAVINGDMRGAIKRDTLEEAAHDFFLMEGDVKPDPPVELMAVTSIEGSATTVDITVWWACKEVHIDRKST